MGAGHLWGGGESRLSVPLGFPTSTSHPGEKSHSPALAYRLTRASPARQGPAGGSVAPSVTLESHRPVLLVSPRGKDRHSHTRSLSKTRPESLPLPQRRFPRKAGPHTQPGAPQARRRAGLRRGLPLTPTTEQQYRHQGLSSHPLPQQLVPLISTFHCRTQSFRTAWQLREKVLKTLVCRRETGARSRPSAGVRGSRKRAAQVS